VQNFMLACRNEGLGTALTTLLCLSEPQVKELLAIPEGFATAACVGVGYPAKGFPSKLTRLPVEEMVFDGRFGEPFTVGS
jgi:nitroreductase